MKRWKDINFYLLIIIEQRIEAQKEYKIESTPTIIINEKKYSGKINYKEFKKNLDKKL